MEIEIKNSTIFIYPDYNELVFGKNEADIALANELKSKDIYKIKDLIIDMRNKLAISKKGINWICKLLISIREKGLTPYIVCGKTLKQILYLSGLDKIVEIYSSTFFERKYINQIHDLEKDLLWNSITED